MVGPSTPSWLGRAFIQGGSRVISYQAGAPIEASHQPLIRTTRLYETCSSFLYGCPLISTGLKLSLIPAALRSLTAVVFCLLRWAQQGSAKGRWHQCWMLRHCLLVPVPGIQPRNITVKFAAVPSQTEKDAPKTVTIRPWFF